MGSRPTRDLEVIDELSHLPWEDYKEETVQSIKFILHGEFEIHVQKVTGIKDHDRIDNILAPICARKRDDLSDPFVIGWLGTTKIFETNCLSNRTTNAIFDETFNVPVCHSSKYITLEVEDRDVVGTDHIGQVVCETKDLEEKLIIEGWFRLLSKWKGKPSGWLKITIQYQPKYTLNYMKKE